ncbi:MAG TPA: apocarotenoid-15,15'-oxygenase [Acidimicrobiaceae bacterium]|nr:apocarotenoid-15,15'-oxygenase [Acidimicrobiaceae bacterium]
MSTVHKRYTLGCLPTDNPYLLDNWLPTDTEWTASTPDLEVIGEIPTDLHGVYLRNGHNQVHAPIGKYHPFDGDGMIHSISFGGGRATYRNRFVRTDGLRMELDAGEPLWTGFYDLAQNSKLDGWGARGRMKDSSSTDVIVHNGLALTSFWQCGDVYQMDPLTLADMGKAPWVRDFPSPTGISAHTKLDEATGELLVFGYSASEPYMHYGVVDPMGNLVHAIDVPLPGPRLPHDMAFSTNYAILNDLPLFWDPALLEMGAHVPKFYRDLPTRFAVVPRRGSTADIRWFEADPTYVLHWINAFEDGDWLVLDGFFQHDPMPAKQEGTPKFQSLYRSIDVNRLQARPHRWRFNLVTGETKEESLSDRVMEFGMINPNIAGVDYRYSYNMTGKPGWFLFDGLVKHDLATGREERYAFGDGVFGSETPFAPRPGGTAEDDGYLVTFTTDMNRDCSECLIFDATRLTDGPIARVRLPERISSGTHSCWTPASQLGAGR